MMKKKSHWIRNLSITLVLAILVTGFGRPGFLIPILQKSPEVGKMEGYEVPEINTDIGFGNSRARTFTPVEGVVIDVPENALDRDREFTMTPMDEDTIEQYENILADDLQTPSLVLDSWRLDAGMEEGEIMPGYFTVSIDLKNYPLDEKEYDAVNVYHFAEDGAVEEYATWIEGSKLMFEGNRNFSITMAIGLVVLVGVTIYEEFGAPYQDSNLSFWRSFWKGDGYVVHENKDDLTSKKLYKITYVRTDAGQGLYDAQSERVREIQEEQRDKIKKKYNITTKNINKQQNPEACAECITAIDKAVESDPRLKEITMNIAKYESDSGLKPDIILKIADQLRSAYQYLKTLKIKMPSPKFEIRICPSLPEGANGVTMSPLFRRTFIELNLSPIKGGTKKEMDHALLTLTHELFHASEREYVYSRTANYKFDEALAQYVEEEAYKYFQKNETISTEQDLGNGSDYQYYAIGLDSFKQVWANGYDSVEFSGGNRADVSYPLAQFIRYIGTNWRQAKEVTMDQFLRSYASCSGITSYNLSTVLMTGFGLSAHEMDFLYRKFVQDQQTKFYAHAGSLEEDSEAITGIGAARKYPWAYNNTVINDKVHVDLSNANDGWNVHMRSFLTASGVVSDWSLLLVGDKELKTNLPDFTVFPAKNLPWTNTKYGLFVPPQPYTSTEYPWIYEVDGSEDTDKGHASGYTLYLMVPPTISGSVSDDGLLVFNLPEKSAQAKDGCIDGYRVTINCSDGKKTVKYYKIEGAGEEIKIKTSSLRKSKTKPEEASYKIDVCEYINKVGGGRFFGPDSSTLSDSMQSIMQSLGAHDGDITVSIMWDNNDDIDLHCMTPNGNEIYFSNKTADGGELDVDRQVNGDDSVSAEHIYFKEPGPGKYRFWVVNYTDRSEGNTTVTVEIVVDGKLTRSVYSVASRQELGTVVYGEGEEAGMQFLDPGTDSGGN